MNYLHSIIIYYFHYTDRNLTSFDFSFQTFLLATTKNFFQFFLRSQKVIFLVIVSRSWIRKIVTFSKTYPSSSSSKVSKAVTKFWFWFFNFLFWALYLSLVVLSCSIWSFKFCIVFLHSSTSSSWPVYGFKDFHWLRKQHSRYTALAIYFFH